MTLSTAALDFSNSNRLYVQACQLISGGTTQGKAPDSLIRDAYPTYAARAKGAYLWDVDGHQFVDWILGYGIVVLGYCETLVDEAAIAEIRQGFSTSLTKPIQNRLAELLVELIPCAELVHFFKAGSDATTAAVRLARIWTGRGKVIRWGYNGWHDWCCKRSPGIPSYVRDDILTFEYNDLDSLDEVFRRNPESVACVIMMPFETELPRPGFLQGVKELAHRYGALFILDEMRSGFRMALGGAQQYYGVTPDLATFSKALANGYAISTLVGRRDIMQRLQESYVSSTFYTDSAPMAAAVATIERLKQGDVIPHLWRIGEQLQAGLSRLLAESGVEAHTTGAPPMPYLVFDYEDPEKRGTAERTFYTNTTRGGVLLHPYHHWFVSFAHTESDLDRTLAACQEALLAVRRALRAL